MSEEHLMKIEVDGWHFSIKHPENNTKNPRILLLLHGYQGNEDVMWVLTKPVPDDYLIIAPRAPIKVAKNQYVWHEITSQWPGIDHYQQITSQLLKCIDRWLDSQNISTKTYAVMGFSQGAVMAYSLAFLHPGRINRIAALAGFFPHTWWAQVDMEKIKSKPFFIAHGTQDDIIPIKKAYQVASLLKENGAQVTFCEADIGHKLSASCFKGLGEFFD